MTATEVGYEHVRTGVKVRPQQTPATVVQAIAWAILCIVVAQRVTPAALARAVPAAQRGSGRARVTRVRRWWMGPSVGQAVVSPYLIAGSCPRIPPMKDKLFDWGQVLGLCRLLQYP